MNTIELINRIADVWAGYMAHGIIETAFLLGFVSVIYAIFKKKISSHFAYWLFLFVLIKLLCPFEIRVPQWMTYLSAKQSITSAVGWAAQPLHLPAEINPEKIHSFTEQTIPLVDLSSQRVVSQEPNIRPASFAGETGSLQIPISNNAILMGLWCIITLIFLSGFALNQWRTQRWIRKNALAQQCINNPLYEELTYLSNIQKSIPLFQSRELTSPVAVGLIKPRLFVPENFFEDLTPKQASWILLHELMHVQRCDLWIATLQRLLQIVFFFNPAVWIANWVVNQFREYACDDAALVICNASRRDCGEGLLSVLENIKQIPSPVSASLGLLQPYSMIRKRLERILDTRRLVQPKLSLAAAGLLVLIGIMVLPYVRAIETNALNTPYTMTDNDDNNSQDGSYTLSGIVLDEETNSPVSDAEVCLYPKGRFYLPDQKLSGKTNSGKDGKFAFSNLGSGIYYPIVFSTRYQPYHPNTDMSVVDPNGEVRIHRTNQNPTVTLKLQKGLCANITVLSPDGNPLPDAKVTIPAIDINYHLFTGQTDSLGRVSFSNLPQTQVFAIAQKTGYGESWSDVFVPGTNSNPAEIKLKMAKPSSISGKIVNKEGNGIPGVTVNLRNTVLPNFYAAFSLIKNETTGNDGKYQFTDLGEGTYNLSESNPDPSKILWYKVTAAKDINLKQGTVFNEPDRVIEKITPSQSVRIQVVSSKEKPLPQAHVNIYPDINELSDPGSLAPLYADRGSVKQVNEDGDY